MKEQRGEGGRFSPEHTDADILAAVRAHEPAATSEVAGEVGMTRQGVDRRLRRLRDDGRVNSKKIGASLVWFAPANVPTASTAPAPETPDPTPDDPDAHEESETGAERAASEEGVPTTPDTAEADTGDVMPRDDELVADVRAYLADRPPRKAHAKEAVLDVFRLLRERGTMETGELKDALYPEYGDQYDSKTAMWSTLDRYLKDVPGVMKPGYGEWGYAGDDVVRGAVGETDTGGVYDPTEEFES